MTVDFSGLVLGPCMEAFAISVRVLPIKSQPMAAPYVARGSLHVDNINVAMDDGGTFSSRVLKLGIKLDEYVVSPAQYDVIEITASNIPMGYVTDELNPSAVVQFLVDNDQPDGQGGTTLILKRKP